MGVQLTSMREMVAVACAPAFACIHDFWVRCGRPIVTCTVGIGMLFTPPALPQPIELDITCSD